MYVCMYVGRYVCMYVYVNILIYIYIYIYLYIQVRSYMKCSDNWRNMGLGWSGSYNYAWYWLVNLHMNQGDDSRPCMPMAWHCENVTARPHIGASRAGGLVCSWISWEAPRWVSHVFHDIPIMLTELNAWYWWEIPWHSNIFMFNHIHISFAEVHFNHSYPYF